MMHMTALPFTKKVTKEDRAARPSKIPERLSTGQTVKALSVALSNMRDVITADEVWLEKYETACNLI